MDDKESSTRAARGKTRSMGTCNCRVASRTPMRVAPNAPRRARNTLKWHWTGQRRRSRCAREYEELARVVAGQSEQSMAWTASCSSRARTARCRPGIESECRNAAVPTVGQLLRKVGGEGAAPCTCERRGAARRRYARRWGACSWHGVYPLYDAFCRRVCTNATQCDAMRCAIRFVVAFASISSQERTRTCQHSTRTRTHARTVPERGRCTATKYRRWEWAAAGRL